MLKLSKKVEYGLIALLHMDSRREGGLVTAKELAEAYAIPSEALNKVMQALARSGMVESVKGVHGGYRLAKDLGELSVGDVAEQLDGPVQLTGCCDGSTDCLQLRACTIKQPVQKIQSEVVGYLRDLRLDRFRTVPPVVVSETGGRA